MALHAAQVPIYAGIAVSGAAVGDNMPIRVAFNDFDSRTEPFEVTQLSAGNVGSLRLPRHPLCQFGCR